MKKTFIIALLFIFLTGCSNSKVNESKVDTLEFEVNESKIDTLESKVDTLESEIKELRELIAEQSSTLDELNNNYKNHLYYFNSLEMDFNMLKSYVENTKDYYVSYGWIDSFSLGNHMICFDSQEWISNENLSRITELGLNFEDDFPNGFYLYNEKETSECYKLNDLVVTYKLSQEQQSEYINRTDFETYINSAPESSIFCIVIFSDGEVVAVKETYLP